MQFAKLLREMINGNTDVECWQSNAQVDEIDGNTKFVVATTQINTGLMCGGDGRVYGEWAWFNDNQDLIDYITRYVIPIRLCQLEEQPPELVMNGVDDETIFDYEFTSYNLPLKDEFFKLYSDLKEIEKCGNDFQKIKAALANSQSRSEAIEKKLIFGYLVFDSYKEACKYLLDEYAFSLNNTDKEILQRITGVKLLSKKDSETLCQIFMCNPLE